MIEYASEILQQLLAATDQAFQEIIYPVAGGEIIDEDVQERTMRANSELPRGPERRDAPGTAAAGTINQAVVATAHIVGAAARFFRACDAEALSLFIASELEEGNAFMLADLQAIRSAARECGIETVAS